MVASIWIVAVSAIVLGMWFVKWRRVRHLPEMSDRDFGRCVAERFDVIGEEAIDERHRLSKLLGIPAAKILPDVDFGNLLKATTQLDRLVALGHLEDEALAEVDTAKMRGELKVPTNAAAWVVFATECKRRREVPGR